MVVDVMDLVGEARVLLDMDRADTELLGLDAETLRLDEGLARQAETAARQVVSSAPAELLESGHNISGAESVAWKELPGGTWRGAMRLPKDFLRLVELRMSDWEREVRRTVAEDSVEYAMQGSRQPGVHGCPERPVAAVVRVPTGLELRFWSCLTDAATAESALYCPLPSVDRQGGIDIPWRLRRAVARTMAGLWLAGAGEAERASGYFETAKSEMT